MLYGTMEYPDAVIKGRIKSDAVIKGKIVGEFALKATVNVSYATDYYNGEYEVTPTVDEQILYTSNKNMRDDVTIHSIPFYEVSNESGGSTVIIGGDIEWLV